MIKKGRSWSYKGKGIMSLFEGQDAERAMGGYETFDGQKM